MDISFLNLQPIKPVDASEHIPKDRGVYCWFSNDENRLLYVGRALGAKGLFHRIVNQHLNPNYLEFRAEKQTSKDQFQLKFAIKKVINGKVQFGIDKSAFRKSIGRKLKIKPGADTVDFIKSNLYVKLIISSDVKDIINIERFLIKEYQPEFNTSMKKIK